MSTIPPSSAGERLRRCRVRRGVRPLAARDHSWPLLGASSRPSSRVAMHSVEHLALVRELMVVTSLSCPVEEIRQIPVTR